MSVRLAVLATHPIQYYTPWFEALAQRPELTVRVFYAQIPDRDAQGVGFDRAFAWDAPLLDGHDFEVLPNARRRPGIGGFWESSTPTVGERLSTFAPDAVLLTGWNQRSLLQGLRAARRLGAATLVRGESNDLKRRPAVVRLLQRMLLRRYDAFLAIGNANEEFYLARGVTRDRIIRCPYFVDNARLGAAAAELLPRRDELRERWSVPRDAFCIAFVGKLIAKKRPLDLVEALASRRGMTPPLHLLVVGSGALEAEMRERCDDLKVSASFTGFLNQSEIAAAYVACDALSLPSDAGETWGLVVNEAMACGRPAIVSDRVGCGSDLVEPGRTGERYPVGDVARLAAALAAMAGNVARAREMGALAQERVRVHFSANGAAAAVVEALRHLGLEACETIVGASDSPVSVVIPTLDREQVLLDTIERVLRLDPPPAELLVVDQTRRHDPRIESELGQLDAAGKIRWIRLDAASIPAAMNHGLLLARGRTVVFLDDDVIPAAGLLGAHLDAQRDARVVAGQVLQPGEQPEMASGANFRFSSTERRTVTELMGGNFSIDRELALAVGGFDENFVGAAYRFEAEFAQRVGARRETILFEPAASVHHLRAPSGGTRSYGDHLTTTAPAHAVGRYYYLLRVRPRGWRRSFLTSIPAAVRTRHHLRRPWYVPLTLLAEIRGALAAARLHTRGPRLLQPTDRASCARP